MALVDDLAALKPLQKVHYSWPFEKIGRAPLLQPSNQRLLAQYVRLTRAAPLSLDYASPAEVATVKAVCEQQNATIGLSTTPYRRMTANQRAVDDWGDDYAYDVAHANTRYNMIKNMLGPAAKRVSAIFVDLEYWQLSDSDKMALDNKNAVIHKMALDHFPQAKVVQYDRGAVVASATDAGWMDEDYYSLDEPGEFFACHLYTPIEWSLMQESYRRTVARAQQHGVKEVIPYISLGYTLTRNQVSWTPTQSSYVYPQQNSWCAGFEINNAWAAERPARFAPWNHAPFVYFYPPPFDPRVAHWNDHFLAYCRGAHNVPHPNP